MSLSHSLSLSLSLFLDIDLISRSAAHSMDEQRKEHIAYEYLCHLEEAKK